VVLASWRALADSGHESLPETDVRKTLEPSSGPCTFAWRLDHNACYMAVSCVDARFAGRFFSSGQGRTKIYCRHMSCANPGLSKNFVILPHSFRGIRRR